jgi:hypothetical protein
MYFQFASGVPVGKTPVPDALTPVLKITGFVLQLTAGCAQTGVDAAAARKNEQNMNLRALIFDFRGGGNTFITIIY